MPGNSKKFHTAGEGSFRFGEFDLYPSERRLCRGGQDVALSPKVFDALLLFVQNAERLVRREQLIEALWPDAYVTDANLTNVIVSLRKLLGREAIQTVSKFGYRFCMSVLGEPGIQQATYATFLQGKELAQLRSLESVTRARDLFALCVAEDPTFAAAWAWQGRCCRFLDKFKGGSTENLGLAQASFRRALAIDPHLACGHHFYTQLQIDLGESHAAAVRLVGRLVARGDEPESFAGLVQALRFCGLLDLSVVAHTRAIQLDPALTTSVPHTHFLRGDYPAVLETYAQTRYYLDAATWGAMGDAARARVLLKERLDARQLSPLMDALMRSLLHLLDGHRDEAFAIMQAVQIEREPEVLFYLARHYAMLGSAAEAVQCVRRARQEGLTSSYTLRGDKVFATIRGDAGFSNEIVEAERLERIVASDLARAAGGRLATILPLDSVDTPG